MREIGIEDDGTLTMDEVVEKFKVKAAAQQERIDHLLVLLEKVYQDSVIGPDGKVIAAIHQSTYMEIRSAIEIEGP